MRLPRADETTTRFAPRGGLLPSPNQQTAKLAKRVAELEAVVDRLKERVAELELEG